MLSAVVSLAVPLLRIGEGRAAASTHNSIILRPQRGGVQPLRWAGAKKWGALREVGWPAYGPLVGRPRDAPYDLRCGLAS